MHISLNEVLEAWGIDKARAAKGLNMSIRRMEKDFRRNRGHSGNVLDLMCGTGVLISNIKEDRIPQIVRKPSDALDGESLIDFYDRGDMAAIKDGCFRMFAWGEMND